MQTENWKGEKMEKKKILKIYVGNSNDSRLNGGFDSNPSYCPEQWTVYVIGSDPESIDVIKTDEESFFVQTGYGEKTISIITAGERLYISQIMKNKGKFYPYLGDVIRNVKNYDSDEFDNFDIIVEKILGKVEK